MTGRAVRPGSVLAPDGTGLWVAGPGSATVDHLVRDDRPGAYRRVASHSLAALLDLPRGTDSPADVAGLGRLGRDLWVVGAHTARREPLRPGRTAGFAEVRTSPNGHLLARMPVTGGAGPAVLGGPDGSPLADLLAADPHLAPFVGLPGDDNGLEVRGLAVTGGRCLVGLRGPVVGGWAVVLELTVRPGLELAALRKHFVPLGGRGVAQLLWHGGALLILAAARFRGDRSITVHRWSRVPRPGPDDHVAAPGDVHPVLDTPGDATGLVRTGATTAAVLTATPTLLPLTP